MEYNTKTDSIDLIKVIRNIWQERRLIIKILAVCFVLGVLVIVGSKKEYESECTFIISSPKNGVSSSALLEQFGGLAGISMNNDITQTMINPDMFPGIINSTSFMLDILKSDITINPCVGGMNYFFSFSKRSKFANGLWVPALLSEADAVKLY